jgi:hypothetical protein
MLARRNRSLPRRAVPVNTVLDDTSQRKTPMQKNKSRSPLTATLTSKGKPQREISVHETQRVFVVDAWNRIFLFESAEAAVHAGFHNPFASASELGEIVGGGTARVVAIWNGLAADTTSGPVGSVTRFASRDAGLKRIWSEINRVQPPSGTAGKKTELPIPDIDIPPVIGPVIEARKVKNTETRAKVFGFPVTQAIAWMGANWPGSGFRSPRTRLFART